MSKPDCSQLEFFAPLESGYLQVSEHWCETKDADPVALNIFKRHYSSYNKHRDGQTRMKFIGPGEYLLLISHDGDAIFAWRKFISMDNRQQGVNCSIFRNEGKVLSSVLIQEAMNLAWRRWPGERLYTYVNPRKVVSRNPGYCFKCAGWTNCGMSHTKKLLILEVTPHSYLEKGLRNEFQDHLPICREGA